MSNDESEKIIKMNMLDNAIDFILKGIDELFTDKNELIYLSSPIDKTSACYKYGYLHLFSGYLLLLKERLNRHMPELIYKGKISDIKQKLGKNETPNTIDLDEALERLEIGPRFTFSDNELKTIRRMQAFRNQFEHYEVHADKYELWANVSDFLTLVDKFLINELQINLEYSAESFELGQKIENIDSVWQRVKKRREEDWKEEILRQLENLKISREDVLEELIMDQRSSKGEIIPFMNCPICNKETLIIHGEYAGICANPECYSVFPLTRCKRCDEITIGHPWEFHLCEACDEWWNEQ
jgi:hypothetical protein